MNRILTALVAALVLLLLSHTEDPVQTERPIEVMGSIGPVPIRVPINENIVLRSEENGEVPSPKAQNFHGLRHVHFALKDGLESCSGPDWFRDVCEPLQNNPNVDVSYVDVQLSRQHRLLLGSDRDVIETVDGVRYVARCDDWHSAFFDWFCDYFADSGDLKYRSTFTVKGDEETDISTTMQKVRRFVEALMEG